MILSIVNLTKEFLNDIKLSHYMKKKYKEINDHKQEASILEFYCASGSFTAAV